MYLQAFKNTVSQYKEILWNVRFIIGLNKGETEIFGYSTSANYSIRVYLNREVFFKPEFSLSKLEVESYNFSVIGEEIEIPLYYEGIPVGNILRNIESEMRNKE